MVYVDGFNLYFGLKTKGWKKYYWLNIQKLAKSLLKKDQKLVYTKYFTSRVRQNEAKQKRQNKFIESLETLKDFSIYYGKYLINDHTCSNCGYKTTIPSEKMTDVNIAVEMLSDAYQDRYDIAIIISADSDLTGTIKSIRNLFPEKKVIAAFPPSRTSWELKQVVNAYFIIGEGKLRKSQFPKEVVKENGYIIKRPERWI